ncbi:sulfite exporter TauE/SafE [Holospora obtusa F1]|uniref:Probable membrane transporter protein n=1 Tax=Holospora obtusa F1 TaxID=1399147 RepID=W6TDX8_HOLOB|nr:sulfite exporter TauE/SafE family protein [Holospora obtusa]ETZ07031.1 sulfite exporter TauE/SafE [Holospora obtusa F1]
MELLGYIALAAMGITLGLVGAGGSILTIPILVYLLNVPIILATSYSLIVVGSTAFMGLLRYRHHILFKKAVVFLIPSVFGVFTARHFMIPALPHTIGSLFIDKALVVLLLIFMSVAGYFMIKNSPLDAKNHLPKNQNIKVILIGLALGIIMGLLGAGGGFLIIPTLVLLMGFTMQEAVPTSLFIITVNSVIGFAADQHQFMADDWSNLAKYLAPAFFGMLTGLYIAKFIQGESLKKAFGYFVWVIGIAILIKEFIL